MGRLLLVFATPEGRAGLRGTDRGALAKPLGRALLYALPAAGLIKLFHDWAGNDGKSVCVSKLAYILFCFVLCAAVEVSSVASDLVDTGSDLGLSTKYPVRSWSLYLLLGGVWIAFVQRVPFK